MPESAALKPTTFKRVRDLLVRRLGIRPEKVQLRSRLLYDLGIDGDDGRNLLEWFFAEFDLPIPETLHGPYFGPEGMNPLWILPWFRPPKPVVLTVADLVASVDAGEWIEPEASRRP